MSDDENEQPPVPRGFAFAFPAEIAERMKQDHDAYHDRVEMNTIDRENRVFAFIDSLDVEQLMTLRMMCNIDSDASFMNYVDGLAVGWLIHVHKVNPATGKSLEQALAETLKRKDEGETPSTGE